MPAYKPTMELDSYETVVGFFVVASLVFRSMDNICGRNWLIQRRIINLNHFLVTSIHWLDQTFILQENFHLQWRCDQRISLFILRSHICSTKRLHNIFEIICIHIQYMSICLLVRSPWPHSLFIIGWRYSNPRTAAIWDTRPCLSVLV